MLERLADLMCAREAASVCPTNSNANSSNVSVAGIIGNTNAPTTINNFNSNNRGSGGSGSGGSFSHQPYHHSLMASRRNGMAQASWDVASSINSLGSWFGSGPNSRPSPVGFDFAVGGDQGSGGGGSGGGSGAGGSGKADGRNGRGLAGIGDDGAIPEEMEPRVSKEGKGEGEGGKADGTVGLAKVEEGGRSGGAGGSDADAAAATAATAAPKARQMVDDGMHGPVRVGLKFTTASPVTGRVSGRRALRGGSGGGGGRGKMASFFDMYSRGNSRHG